MAIDIELTLNRFGFGRIAENKFQLLCFRFSKWQIEGKSGHYLREDKLQTQGRITTITDSETIKRHLVFARTPSWQGKVFKDVEIARHLQNGEWERTPSVTCAGVDVDVIVDADNWTFNHITNVWGGG